LPPLVATGVFALGILVLFALDRDREARTSLALWISVLWLLIVDSRPVSVWLQMAPVDSPDQFLEGSPIDRWVFLGLFVIGLLVVMSRGQRVVRILRRNGAVLLFFSYCAVSILWSEFPDVAFKRWVKALGDFVIVLIVLTDSEPTVALKRVLSRVGFLLIPISILLIKYYPDLGRGYDSWFGTPILTGVTTNKNSLGVVAVVCGVSAAWRFFEEIGTKDKQHRLKHLLAQGVLLSMALWLLVKANSATSAVCFLVACALLAITSLTKLGRKRAVVHLFALGVISASLFAIFLDSAGSVVAALGRDPTLTGRTDVWHTVLGMNPNPLLGAGFENFWLGPRLGKLWSIYWWHPNEAHNGYIEVYLNLGWIGVALLATLFITGYRNAFAAFRLNLGAGAFRLAFIAIAAVYSMTEAGFRMLNPIWIFFLLVVIAVPEAQGSESPQEAGLKPFNSSDAFRPIGTVPNRAQFDVATMTMPFSTLLAVCDSTESSTLSSTGPNLRGVSEHPLAGTLSDRDADRYDNEERLFGRCRAIREV